MEHEDFCDCGEEDDDSEHGILTELANPDPMPIVYELVRNTAYWLSAVTHASSVWWEDMGNSMSLRGIAAKRKIAAKQLQQQLGLMKND